MRIFLWGLPGSGKSTVGQALAENMGIPFYDLDLLVQKKTERSAAEWISEYGEEIFRQEERNVLLAWNPPDGVLACGGGTPCFYNQDDWMNQQGITFWLFPSFEIIQNNLRQSTISRPLLGKFHAETLVNLLEQRTQHYEKAQFTLRWKMQTSPTELAQGLLKHLQSSGLWPPSPRVL